MANKSISMIDFKQVIRLYALGTSIKSMGRLLGLSRKTVRKYLEKLQLSGYTAEYALGLDEAELYSLFVEPYQASNHRYEELDAELKEINKELRRVGVTRYNLWLEYKERHPSGYNYTQFCYYLRQYHKKDDATMHFEHKAGQEMYIDFTGKKRAIVNPETGEVKYAELFVAILGCSQITYVESVYSQNKEDFIRATENAIHYFGGVAATIIPDNLKSAVNKADKYEADLNREFKHFALHYGTVIDAARPNRPRDKALVENAVKHIYTRCLAPIRGREFHSLSELNEALWEGLEKHNNTKFQKRDYSRRQMFEESEKAELGPLPASKYQIRYSKRLTVNKNCHIYLSEDKHYYSVPYKYIGKKVQVIYTMSTVEVYLNYQRIAFHERDTREYKYTTIREHLPSHHRFVSDWSPEKFINWAAGYGEPAKEYITQVLESKPHPEQAYKSCIGILAIGKKHGRERLNNACLRAMYYGSYGYKVIKNIIDRGYDKTEIKEPEQYVIPDHGNVRGQSMYI